jgi:hypothetical protein
LYSGSPGYLKGKPILFGTVKNGTLTDNSGNQEAYKEITYNLNGFALRGADQKGRCYSVNRRKDKNDPGTLETITGAITKPLIDTVSSLTYFDDPVLTFEDSILYGCTMELTKTEL